MKSTKSKLALFSFVMLIVLCLFNYTSHTTWAADVKTLVKEAKKELRQVEKDMFGGKKDKAIAALTPIKETLLKIKTQDPNNPSLKSLERKFKKLVKDLERRTGRNLGGGSLTVGTSTQVKLPPKPKPKSTPTPTKPAKTPAPAAGDIKTMVKRSNNLLRQAEKNMYAGKNEQAAQQVNEAKAMIEKVKAEDPKNSNLRSLEKKYVQIEKKLKAKMPKATSKKAQAVQPAKTKKAGATKLPYHAKGPITAAKRDLNRIDDYTKRLSDPNWDPKQVLKNMDRTLVSARKNFETGKAKAAEKGLTSHPDFDEIEAKLTETEKKISQAREDNEKKNAIAATQSAEVQGDVKGLTDEYKKVESVFNRATGVVIYYNDFKPVKKLLTQIETFEKNELNNLKAKLKAFGQKYGTTKDEIDKKAEAMGYSDPYYRASFAYTEMTKGIENVKKTRSVMADDLIRRAQDIKDRTSKGIHDFARVKQHTIITKWGQIAAKFDPDNPRVKAFNAKVDGWIAKDLKALNAKIDKAKFPKQASNAPEDAKKLAKTAKQFLQKEEDALAAKGKVSGKVVAVVVTGPWRIFKKNLLGEPIQYNLPITTAVQIQSEKKSNLIRVFHSTMLTQEMKGVKKAPPFLGATVGDSYYVRPSAVK